MNTAGGVGGVPCFLHSCRLERAQVLIIAGRSATFLLFTVNIPTPSLARSLHYGPAPSVVQGGLEGQFVLSFEADAENVQVTEAEELVQMVAYPDVLTRMTVRSCRGAACRGEGDSELSTSCPVTLQLHPSKKQAHYLTFYAFILTPSARPSTSLQPSRRPQTSIAQFLRNDSLVMSPEPVEESFEASVVASRDQILPLALIDFQSAELADLTCPELLARFTPNVTNAIFEV